MDPSIDYISNHLIQGPEVPKTLLESFDEALEASLEQPSSPPAPELFMRGRSFPLLRWNVVELAFHDTHPALVDPQWAGPPPKYLIACDANFWIERATQYLSSKDRTASLMSTTVHVKSLWHSEKFVLSHVDTLLVRGYHKNQVLAMATTLLLPPILLALSDHYKGFEQCVIEGPPEIIGTSKKNIQAAYMVGNGQDKAYPILLSFREQGSLKAKQFRERSNPASLLSATYHIWEEIEETEIKGYKYTEDDIILDKKVLADTKEAAVLGLIHYCPYVAFFDWETLILFHFDQMDLEKTYSGFHVRVTVVDDRVQMRKALLGFFLQAFEVARGGR